MSWNLWWRFGDWQQRRRAILAVLEQERPDICGLQEVWADRDTNLAGWLAAELGMRWAWGPASDQARWQQRIGDPDVRFGVAVLSRWPISDPQVFDLPEEPSRSALSVLVEAPHARIPFVTTHLTAMPLGSSARRSAQLRWLAEQVAQLPSDEHPAVVTGDFNAEPDSDELRLFGGTLTPPVVPGQVFLDAWRFAASGDPGHTWDRRNPYVRQWIEPSARIDYIHVVGRAAGPGHPVSARLGGAGPVDGVWPSDHAAVVAELCEEKD